MNGNRSHYRPEIDGLRAIAVALVLMFHLDPSILPNGFIGVDIFFVISGYVVTLSVIERHDRSVAMAVVSFWKRRILRIYPALLVCIFATMLITVGLVPPFPLEAYNGIMRTGLAAMVGAGNLYLYRGQFNYFRSDLSFNPFVHTWSLGIEEQFYLLFSAVFLALPIIWNSCFNRDEENLHRIRLTATILLSVTSAILFVRGSDADPVGTYFLLPYRYWELGIGSLLALNMRQLSHVWSFFPRLVGEIGQLGGLILIAAIAVSAETSVFPTLVVASATVATVVIIACGHVTGTTTTRLLSSRMFVTTGLGSYSLYLWHWPVFVAFELTFGLHSRVAVALALVIVVCAATLSYFYVELPFRGKTAIVPQQSRSLGLVVVMIVGVAAMEQFFPGFGFLGAKQTWSLDWLPDRAFAYADNGKLTGSDCNLSNNMAIPSTFPQNCIVYPNEEKHGTKAATVLLVGDSIAFADWGMLTVGVRQQLFQLDALSFDGCGIETPDERKSTSCRRYWSTVPDYVRTLLHEGDAVLIASFWRIGSGNSHEQALRTITDIIEAAERVSASVILQAPLPRFKRDTFLCTHEWFRLEYQDCFLDRSAFEVQRAEEMSIIRTLQRNHPRVYIWDPIMLICPTIQCSQFAADKPVFRNWDHLSYYGSTSLGDAFAHFFKSLKSDNLKSN